MAKVKDPVCGMELDTRKAAAKAGHQGKTYYFCSSSCEQKFRSNPIHYAR